ncbi:DNA cytosine methyltransferase [Marilutibacter alkalisoli]|uniref:DNA (cytosine-5-)-methyltransferase n=1 Tax=Marilutibacter alkalisoli TaxID=2591633 RepID=A0A514BU98_9GAMM|nr:DNA cytosine methyltransferase [Lysobacter alkalisoli]QDH70885.1 modification methylase [Lysobacter alkalisoli]
MPDGSRQIEFNLPRTQPVSQLRPGEIIVDLFAGGGGASEALRQALGRDPDIAINHDEWAIGMHAANHPMTRHYQEDIWHADPVAEVAGRPVGWLHASPDCTHFSQAKGGQPRSRSTRSLSWVVVKWAGKLSKDGRAPRVISLENVEQILKWGPLVAKRDKTTGRVLRLDGTVAAPGERVPVDQQYLIPDPRHAGRTWRHFVAALQGLGYTVEWRRLRACDYGAGTSRTRLFLAARRDGEPIRWPEPSHGPDHTHPYVTAADCIDWSIPCPSIFTRKKPLAEATCRRIAKGIQRFVLDAETPFICNLTHGVRLESADEPMRTITGANRGEKALVMPTLVQTGYGERAGQQPRAMDIEAPLGTIVGGGCKHAVAAAHLVKFRGDSHGTPATDPVPTITSGAGAARPAGAAHALGICTAFLEQAAGGPNSNPSRNRGADEPVSTISTSGSQQRLVTADLQQLNPEHEAGALRVAAFLMRYHSTGGQWADLDKPLTSVTTRDRLALVTVWLRGTPYVIVDIGLRMLTPPELYRAQGFPADYIIDRTADGRPITKTAQVRMVGNSVSPPPLCAIARANLDPATVPLAVAA